MLILVQYTGGQTGLEESSVSDESPEFAQCHHDGVSMPVAPTKCGYRYQFPVRKPRCLDQLCKDAQ
jgi:hypothetical protein